MDGYNQAIDYIDDASSYNRKMFRIRVWEKRFKKCRGNNTSTWRLSDHCVQATGTHFSTFSNYSSSSTLRPSCSIPHHTAITVDSSVLFDILGRTVCLAIGNHANGNKPFGQSLKKCPKKDTQSCPSSPPPPPPAAAQKQTATDMHLYGGEISLPSSDGGLSFDYPREKRTAAPLSPYWSPGRSALSFSTRLAKGLTFRVDGCKRRVVRDHKGRQTVTSYSRKAAKDAWWPLLLFVVLFW